jgi:hypothetical protein
MSLAAVRILVGMAATLLAREVAAQAAPAARATTTTFTAVHDGKHAVGVAVQFPVILLPETAIQNTSAGKLTYYVLAVSKDGPYVKEIERLLGSLKDTGAANIREISAAVGDDKRYTELMGGVEGLLKRAFDLKPAPEETIAIEMPGLAGVSSAYKWETVEEPNPFKPFMGDFDRSNRDQYSVDALALRREIINMTLADPPKLDQKLPNLNLNPLFKFTDKKDLDNFNAAVEAYNAELQRRRRYSVERTEADLQLVIDRLDFLFGQPEETLSATVIAAAPLANKTFSRIYRGKTPPAFVRERGKLEASLGRRALAATAVQILSYPKGAAVRLDGREVGVTPYIARSVPAKSKLPVALNKAGVPPFEAVETVPMQPSGVKRYDYMLVTTKPRLLSPEEATRLFDQAFKPAHTFTLAIAAAPPPGPPPKGTKESKDEKKKREYRTSSYLEYVSKLRKAAGDPAGPFAPWFQLVDGQTADVTVEITENRPAVRDLYTHHLAVRMASSSGGDVMAEDILPSVAKPEVPLAAAVLRLKNERWQRALGGE